MHVLLKFTDHAATNPVASHRSVVVKTIFINPVLTEKNMSELIPPFCCIIKFLLLQKASKHS